MAVAVVSVWTIPIKTVALDKHQDAHHVTDLVNQYNAYSGFIMSVVDEPLVLAAKAFVPVWLALVLRPMAGNGDSSARRHHVRTIGSAVARVGLAAAITNAVASVNVQQMSTSVEARMGDSDAIRSEAAPPANNASVNNIFKAFIAPQKDLSVPSCTGTSRDDAMTNQSTLYDLQYQPFFQDLVPEAAVQDQINSVWIDIRNGSIHSASEPHSPSNITSAKQLLALTARLYGGANFSQAQQLIQDDYDESILRFASLAVSDKAITNEDSSFLLPVYEHTNVTFRHSTLAPGIVFDAVTTELHYTSDSTMRQINWMYWHRSETPASAPDRNDNEATATATTRACGSVGCFLDINQSTMLAFQLCDFSKALLGERDNNSCLQNQTGQMILYSNGWKGRAKTLSVERSNESSNTSSGVKVIVSDLKLVKTVTVGILRWEVHNLAEMYQVPCDDSATSCRGIAYNVSRATNKAQVSRVIMTPSDAIRAADLPPFSDARKVYLAKVVGGIPLLESNVEDTSGWRNLEGDECVSDTDRYLALVRNNHLYMEDSYQAAVAGGMYFLFQNGHAIESIPAQPHKFAFVGSRRTVALRASAPLSSVIVSIVGVVVLVACVITLSCAARVVHDRVTQDIDAAKTVDVLVNNEQYPKSLLRCQLGSKDCCSELIAFKASTMQLQLEHGSHDEMVLLDENDGVIEKFDFAMMVSSTKLSSASMCESIQESTQWRANVPLTVNLRRMRMMVVTFVLAAIIVPILVLLVDEGFLLVKVPADEDQVRRLVQDLNFFSGAIGAMVTAPAEMLVSTLTPVLSLVMASESKPAKAMLLGFKIVVIWSLTTAINSINVQSGTIHVESRMGSAAFVRALETNDQEEFAKEWANNTVLRSFINGVLPPTADLNCTKTDGKETWDVETQLSIVQSAAKDSKLDGPLPVSKPKEAAVSRDWVLKSTRQSPTFFLAPKPWHKAIIRSRLTAAASSTFNVSSAIVDNPALPLHPSITSGMDFQDQVSPKSIDNYEVKLSRYQLTQDIDFHVVTEVWDRNVSYIGVNACYATGCLMETALVLWVEVYPLTKVINDTSWSNGLVVVASTEEIRGDKIQLLSNNHTVRLGKPRIHTTRSTGVLRWNTTDLAKRYGAKCVANNKTCVGLSCSLDGNLSQVLLLDEQRFQHEIAPRDRLPLIVHSNVMMSTSNFDQQDWDADHFRGDSCSSDVENTIRNAERNHFYQAGESLEYVSYFAAMLFLFDTARLHDVIPVATKSSVTTLNFDANIEYANLVATIPKQAAIISIVATSILLCLSLYVVAAMQRGRDDDSLVDVTAASIQDTAEMMFDDVQYPKQFLNRYILLTDGIMTDQDDNQLHALDAFHVQGVTLRAGQDVNKATMGWDIIGRQSCFFSERMTEPCDDNVLHESAIQAFHHSSWQSLESPFLTSHTAEPSQDFVKFSR